MSGDTYNGEGKSWAKVPSVDRDTNTRGRDRCFAVPRFFRIKRYYC
jgi:hypothetical protein